MLMMYCIRWVRKWEMWRMTRRLSLDTWRGLGALPWDRECWKMIRFASGRLSRNNEFLLKFSLTWLLLCWLCQQTPPPTQFLLTTIFRRSPQDTVFFHSHLTEVLVLSMVLTRASSPFSHSKSVLLGKGKVGWIDRVALKHICYHM